MRFFAFLYLFFLTQVSFSLAELANPKIEYFGAHFEWNNTPGFKVNGSVGETGIDFIVISKNSNDADFTPVLSIEIQNRDGKKYVISVEKDSNCHIFIEKMGSEMSIVLDSKLVVKSDPLGKNRILVKMRE